MWLSNASKISSYCWKDFSITKFCTQRYSTTSSSPPVILCSSTLRIYSASSVCVKKPTDSTFLISSSCTILSSIFLEKGSLASKSSPVCGPSEPNNSISFTRKASCGSSKSIVFVLIGFVPSNSRAISNDKSETSRLRRSSLSLESKLERTPSVPCTSAMYELNHFPSRTSLPVLSNFVILPD